MGAFSELFAVELEAHDDPPLLIFSVDETSLIVVQSRLEKFLAFRGGRQVAAVMASAEMVSLMTVFALAIATVISDTPLMTFIRKNFNHLLPEELFQLKYLPCGSTSFGINGLV
jgi:hypothetical protein